MGRVVERVGGGLVDGDGASLGRWVWLLTRMDLESFESLYMIVGSHGEGSGLLLQEGRGVVCAQKEVDVLQARRVRGGGYTQDLYIGE